VYLKKIFDDFFIYSEIKKVHFPYFVVSKIFWNFFLYFSRPYTELSECNEMIA